jgi:valyl-tRNA synthetase
LQLGISVTKFGTWLVSLADHWVLSKLDSARDMIADRIEAYKFSEASDIVYHTVWDDVADWYIEASKVEQNANMLGYVLDYVLKLAHPFAPFVTETIWQSLSWHSDSNDILAGSSWPESIEYNHIAAAEFEQLKQLISEARFVISDLPGNEKYDLTYRDDSLIADNRSLLEHMVRGVKSVRHDDNTNGLRLANSGRDVWLDISDDLLYEHQTNLERRLAEVHQNIAKLDARLSNKSYISKAPQHLVEETKRELDDAKSLATRLESELEVVSRD